MHILSEVSSTTSSGGGDQSEQQYSCREKMHSRAAGNSTKSMGQSSKSGANNSNNGGNNSSGGSSALAPLTAENFAERTIDGLLAEHPGELVRTGCPHVVGLGTWVGFVNFNRRDHNFHLPTRSARCFRNTGGRTKHYQSPSKSSPLVKLWTAPW